MRIAIISHQSRLYSTQRLCQAGAERGHEVAVIDPLEWTPMIGPVDVRAKSAEIAIARTATLVMDHSVAVVRDFESLGVPVINSSSSIALAGDKVASLQRLAAQGLPVPRTAMPRSGAALRAFIEASGGPPIVLKLLRGYGGSGVMRADSADAAEALLQVFLDLGQCVLAQEFWGPEPIDIRLLVIHGEVCAAISRTAPQGDFRANVHAGGTAARHDPSPEVQRVAVRAAEACGLDVAGVDLLISHAGMVVTEVNASPGLKALEEATGANIAERIIQATERRTR